MCLLGACIGFGGLCLLGLLFSGFCLLGVGFLVFHHNGRAATGIYGHSDGVLHTALLVARAAQGAERLGVRLVLCGGIVFHQGVENHACGLLHALVCGDVCGIGAVADEGYLREGGGHVGVGGDIEPVCPYATVDGASRSRIVVLQQAGKQLALAGVGVAALGTSVVSRIERLRATEVLLSCPIDMDAEEEVCPCVVGNAASLGQGDELVCLARGNDLDAGLVLADEAHHLLRYFQVYLLLGYVLPLGALVVSAMSGIDYPHKRTLPLREQKQGKQHQEYQEFAFHSAKV